MEKHNIKSGANERKVMEEKYINAEKQTNKQTNKNER
jgi:hypothetical protein